MLQPRYILFLLLTCATGLISAQPVSEQVVNIPFTLTDGGHILIKATVNGAEGNFIFDTGAGLNMLTKKFADRVKNLKKEDGFYTGHRATGEAITTDLWTANQLDMGGLSFQEQEFSVIDIDFPLDGLLSLMPFRDIPVTMDYKNKLLTVETGASLRQLLRTGTSVPIQLDDERGKALSVFTRVKVNDTLTLQIALDSGAGFNVFRFNSRYMPALHIDSSRVQSEYRKSDFTPTTGNRYYFSPVKSLTALNQKIGVKSINGTFIEGLIYEGITGVNWLGEVITIDMPNKRLIIN